MNRFYFLGNSTNSQMMGMVFLTPNKTVIIDGGTPGDAYQLVNFLKEKERLAVDAWFFTHPHHDHIGAFTEIISGANSVSVKNIYFAFPPIEKLLSYQARTEYETDLWNRFYSFIENNNLCHNIKPSDKFFFDSLSVNVLRVYNPTIEENFINNSSAVFRVDSPTKKVLILGDLGIEGGNEVKKLCSKQDLFADYTQLSHHGQHGVAKDFYEYIKPVRCLWATPDWLWDNVGENGKGSGPFATLETRKWMDELGAKEHFVSKDGISEIIL